MKTTFRAGPPAFSLACVRRLAPVVVAVMSASTFAAEPPPASAELKTHTLFMGVDVLVEQNKQFYRVQDVIGGSFVINVGGKLVNVPANWGRISMKVDHALKLTATSVSIDHLKAERAYTPGNDPVKKFNAEQGQMQAGEEAMTSRQVNLVFAEIGATAAKRFAVNGVEGFKGPDPVVAELAFNSASASAQADFGKSNSIVGQMQDEVQEELFDAIDIEFDVSSAQPLRRPYAVITAQYHARGAKPGETSGWLYATELDPLDAKAHKVRIRQGGFPPGFALENYQVHLYDGGQEVATTVADKQVPLTRKEAFAYLLLDYLGSHKGATLPAAPAMGKPGPEARATLSAEQLKKTYYVKVSKDGQPVAAFVDPSFSSPVDTVVAALVEDVRFYPALEGGKPADGTAELRFSRLIL